MNFSDTSSSPSELHPSNKLRTTITVAIIALGIASFNRHRTAIEACSRNLQESFSAMGINGFTLRYKTAFSDAFGQKAAAANRQYAGKRKNNPI